MKNLKTTFIFLLFWGLCSTGFSQTKADYHKQLTTYHTNIKEHAEAIAIGTTMTVEEQIKHNAEAAKNLEAAKIAYANLLKTMPNKDEIKSYRQALDNLYTVTTYQITTLDKDLKTPAPDQVKIKQQAATIHASISKAEKEHQALLNK